MSMYNPREESRFAIEDIIICIVQKKKLVKPIEFIIDAVKYSPQKIELGGKLLPDHSINSIITILCNYIDANSLPATAKAVLFSIWQYLRRIIVPRTIWVTDQNMIDITLIEYIYTYLLPKSISISWTRNIRHLLVKAHTRDDTEVQIYYSLTERLLGLIHDGNTLELKPLLSQYIYMKLPMLSGWSLLHYAVSVDYAHATVVTHIIDTLIQGGLSINILDYELQSPLHIAAIHMNYLAIVKLSESRLLQKNLPDKDGYIPLQRFLLTLSKCKRRKRIIGYDERVLVILKTLLPYDDKASLWELWKLPSSLSLVDSGTSNSNSAEEETQTEQPTIHTSFISQYHSSIYYCVAYGSEIVGEEMLKYSFPLRITTTIFQIIKEMLFACIKQFKFKIFVYLLHQLVDMKCFDAVFAEAGENVAIELWTFCNQLLIFAIIHNNPSAFESILDIIFPCCNSKEDFLLQEVMTQATSVYCQCFYFFYVAILSTKQYHANAEMTTNIGGTIITISKYNYVDKLLKKFPHHLCMILLLPATTPMAIRQLTNEQTNDIFFQWMKRFVGDWTVPDMLTLLNKCYPTLTIACMVGNQLAVEAMLKKLYHIRNHPGNTNELNKKLQFLYMHALMFSLYGNQLMSLDNIRSSLGINEFVKLLVSTGDDNISFVLEYYLSYLMKKYQLAKNEYNRITRKTGISYQSEMDDEVWMDMFTLANDKEILTILLDALTFSSQQKRSAESTGTSISVLHRPGPTTLTPAIQENALIKPKYVSHPHLESMEILHENLSKQLIILKNSIQQPLSFLCASSSSSIRLLHLLNDKESIPQLDIQAAYSFMNNLSSSTFICEILKEVKANYLSQKIEWYNFIPKLCSDRFKLSIRKFPKAFKPDTKWLKLSFYFLKLFHMLDLEQSYSLNYVTEEFSMDDPVIDLRCWDAFTTMMTKVTHTDDSFEQFVHTLLQFSSNMSAHYYQSALSSLVSKVVLPATTEANIAGSTATKQHASKVSDYFFPAEKFIPSLQFLHIWSKISKEEFDQFVLLYDRTPQKQKLRFMTHYHTSTQIENASATSSSKTAGGNDYLASLGFNLPSANTSAAPVTSQRQGGQEDISEIDKIRRSMDLYQYFYDILDQYLDMIVRIGKTYFNKFQEVIAVEAVNTSIPVTNQKNNNNISDNILAVITKPRLTYGNYLHCLELLDVYTVISSTQSQYTAYHTTAQHPVTFFSSIFKPTNFFPSTFNNTSVDQQINTMWKIIQKCYHTEQLSSKSNLKQLGNSYVESKRVYSKDTFELLLKKLIDASEQIGYDNRHLLAYLLPCCAMGFYSIASYILEKVFTQLHVYQNIQLISPHVLYDFIPVQYSQKSPFRVNAQKGKEGRGMIGRGHRQTHNIEKDQEENEILKDDLFDDFQEHFASFGYRPNCFAYEEALLRHRDLTICRSVCVDHDDLLRPNLDNYSELMMISPIHYAIYDGEEEFLLSFLQTLFPLMVKELAFFASAYYWKQLWQFVYFTNNFSIWKIFLIHFWKGNHATASSSSTNVTLYLDIFQDLSLLYFGNSLLSSQTILNSPKYNTFTSFEFNLWKFSLTILHLLHVPVDVSNISIEFNKSGVTEGTKSFLPVDREMIWFNYQTNAAFSHHPTIGNDVSSRVHSGISLAMLDGTWLSIDEILTNSHNLFRTTLPTATTPGNLDACCSPGNNNSNNNILHYCVQCKQFPWIEFLIDEDPYYLLLSVTPNRQGITSLYQCLLAEEYSLVQMVVQRLLQLLRKNGVISSPSDDKEAKLRLENASVDSSEQSAIVLSMNHISKDGFQHPLYRYEALQQMIIEESSTPTNNSQNRKRIHTIFSNSEYPRIWYNLDDMILHRLKQQLNQLSQSLLLPNSAEESTNDNTLLTGNSKKNIYRSCYATMQCIPSIVTPTQNIPDIQDYKDVIMQPVLLPVVYQNLLLSSLQYAKELWQYIVSRNFLRFVQCSTSSQYCKLDSFIRARQILSILNIPYSYLTHHTGSSNTESTPNRVNQTTSPNPVADYFQFDIYTINQQITWSIYQQFTMLLSGWLRLRAPSSTVPAAASSSIPNNNRKKTFFQRSSQQIEDHLLLYHMPWLNCITLGHSHMLLPSFWQSSLFEYSSATIPFRGKNAEGVAGTPNPQEVHHQLYTRDLLKMMKIELSNSFSTGMAHSTTTAGYGIQQQDYTANNLMMNTKTYQDIEILYEGLELSYLLLEFAKALCTIKLYSLLTLSSTGTTNPSAAMNNSSIFSSSHMTNAASTSHTSNIVTVMEKNTKILKELNSIKFKYHPIALQQQYYQQLRTQYQGLSSFVLTRQKKQKVADITHYEERYRMKFIDHLTPQDMKIFLKVNSNYYSNRLHYLRNMLLNSLSALLLDLKQFSLGEFLCRAALTNNSNTPLTSTTVNMTATTGSFADATGSRLPEGKEVLEDILQILKHFYVNQFTDMNNSHEAKNLHEKYSRFLKAFSSIMSLHEISSNASSSMTNNGGGGGTSNSETMTQMWKSLRQGHYLMLLPEEESKIIHMFLSSISAGSGVLSLTNNGGTANNNTVLLNVMNLLHKKTASEEMFGNNTKAKGSEDEEDEDLDIPGIENQQFISNSTSTTPSRSPHRINNRSNSNSKYHRKEQLLHDTLKSISKAFVVSCDLYWLLSAIYTLILQNAPPLTSSESSSMTISCCQQVSISGANCSTAFIVQDLNSNLKQSQCYHPLQSLICPLFARRKLKSIQEGSRQEIQLPWNAFQLRDKERLACIESFLTFDDAFHVNNVPSLTDNEVQTPSRSLLCLPAKESMIHNISIAALTGDPQLLKCLLDRFFQSIPVSMATEQSILKEEDDEQELEDAQRKIFHQMSVILAVQEWKYLLWHVVFASPTCASPNHVRHIVDKVLYVRYPNNCNIAYQQCIELLLSYQFPILAPSADYLSCVELAIMKSMSMNIIQLLIMRYEDDLSNPEINGNDRFQLKFIQPWIGLMIWTMRNATQIREGSFHSEEMLRQDSNVMDYLRVYQWLYDRTATHITGKSFSIATYFLDPTTQSLDLPNANTNTEDSRGGAGKRTKPSVPVLGVSIWKRIIADHLTFWTSQSHSFALSTAQDRKILQDSLQHMMFNTLDCLLLSPYKTDGNHAVYQYCKIRQDIQQFRDCLDKQKGEFQLQDNHHDDDDEIDQHSLRSTVLLDETTTFTTWTLFDLLLLYCHPDMIETTLEKTFPFRLFMDIQEAQDDESSEGAYNECLHAIQEYCILLFEYDNLCIMNKFYDVCHETLLYKKIPSAAVSSSNERDIRRSKMDSDEEDDDDEYRAALRLKSCTLWEILLTSSFTYQDKTYDSFLELLTTATMVSPPMVYYLLEHGVQIDIPLVIQMIIQGRCTESKLLWYFSYIVEKKPSLHVEFFDYLTESSLAPSLGLLHGETLFHIFSRRGYLQLIQFWMKQKLDDPYRSGGSTIVMKEDEYGYTPLHCSIYHGHRHVTHYLKSFCAKEILDAVGMIIYFFRAALLSKSTKRKIV